MFIGSLFPWLINFLSHSITLNPFEIDYNVYALALTSPFFAVAMFRSRLLDLVPVARDRVFDSMTESVVVVDNSGRIADINHAARMTMGISTAVIGTEMHDSLSHWPGLVGIFTGDTYGSFEVNTGEDKWFTANLSRFLDRNGQSIGQILILSDISDKKSLEIKIFNNEKRLKSDVTKVRNHQAIMMPDFTVVKGFDIGSVFIPVDELSGDFIDGFFIDEINYQIIVCDVIDHGILPAFIGMEIRSMFRAMSGTGIMPSDLISMVNLKLVDDFSELSIFATATICLINTISGQIIIAGTGHPPSLLYSTEHEKAGFIETTGSLIGLITSKTYNDIVINMTKNDVLLLYTDGISEAMDLETQEMYGSDCMQTDFAALSSNPSKKIVNSIVDKVMNFTGHIKIIDDMTMVCIKKT